MQTLTEYFKDNEFIPKGSFLLSEKNGRLYVLSAFVVGEIWLVELIDGWTDRHNVRDSKHITASNIRYFFYEADLDEDETLSLVQILTKQEAVNEFSSLVLGAI